MEREEFLSKMFCPKCANGLKFVLVHHDLELKRKDVNDVFPECQTFHEHLHFICEVCKFRNVRSVFQPKAPLVKLAIGEETNG